MKTITREEWIEALESGEYEQGRGTLRNGKAFCCLGVACDLAEVPYSFNTGRYLGVPADAWMPTAVSAMLGLPLNMQTRCAHMNDADKLTFPQIAAELRKEFNMEPRKE